MKKSIIALALIAASGSVSAEAPKHHNGELAEKITEITGAISYKDKEGYKELALYAGKDNAKELAAMVLVNETSAGELQRLLNNSDKFVEWNGGEITKDEAEQYKNDAWSKHVVTAYDKINETILSLEGKEQEHALDVLSSISIQDGKTLLETIQSNTNAIDHLTGESIEDFDPVSKAKSIVKDAYSGDLQFSGEIKSSCGISISKSDGKLVFGDMNASESESAKFSVQTNVAGGATVTLDTLTGSSEVADNIKYVVDGKELRDGKFNAGHNENFSVVAKADVESDQLYAGSYHATTTITVACN